MREFSKNKKQENEQKKNTTTTTEDDDARIIQRWLNDMKLAEMIGQMSQIDIMLLLEDDGKGGKSLKKADVELYIGEMGIGSVLNCVGGIQWTAQQYRQTLIQLNQVAKQYNRLPVIWGLDSVHGANYIRNAILSPQPLNIAATWNVSMARQAGMLASRDTRAAGINWLFSPLLGLAVEPRWSRVYETFGEDPLVVGDMATAMIEGIQQQQAGIPSRAAACGKHFVGYSAPQTGHDRSPSWIPTRHLYQYFVPPWKKAIKSVKTVMESYTEIDGVPLVANRDLLQYLLRQRLNFTSVLVTDYQEIRNLHNWHHIVKSDPDAVITSLQEGSVDMSMIPWDASGFATAISEGLQQGRLTKERIRESAERVLQLKQDLRMFDETITMIDPNLDQVGTDREAILPMVQDSIILAENKNNLLPLDPKRRLKIHVTGPTANSLPYQSGGWTGQWQGAPDESCFTYGSTVWDSLRIESAWDVTYSCGVDVLGKECEDPDASHIDESIIDQVKHWAGLTPTTSMAMAVESANAADVTIICVGEEAYAEKPGDIRSLELPKGQADLVHAIERNTNTKIILVYFGGRPRLLSDMTIENVDAVILGFLPGPDAGPAIVDVVTGRVNPSGRLPITYPAADDGGGSPYWRAVTDQCTSGEGTLLPHYVYVPCPVQWDFGHGLSYTTFEYSDFSAGGIDDDLHIKVTVKNTGNRAGAETAMFFTFDESRLTTPEYKRLRAFKKVGLSPGESVVVEIMVAMDDLRFVGPHDDRHYILDPKMISYLGVGYSTDCRRRDGDHNPDENPLCVRLQGTAPNKLYIAACEAACDLWKKSPCTGELALTSTKCLDMCADAGSDGWAWNYVACLESVLLTAPSPDSPAVSCRSMTTMCRDIFDTGNSIKYGSGAHGHSSIDAVEKGTSSDWVALATALLASFMMILLLRGWFSKRKKTGGATEDERFAGIQFTTLKNPGLDEC